MAEEEKLSLEIVAPEKMVMTKKVDMVTISGAEGDFGVLPGHAALVSSIRPGFLEIEDNKDIEKLFIAGGFIEVLEDKVSILATEVLSSEQIDVSKCITETNRCYKCYKIGATSIAHPRNCWTFVRHCTRLCSTICFVE